MLDKGRKMWLMTYTVTSQPPAQGLCEVRFLPDPVDCWRPTIIGKYGPWTAEYGREEEGVLKDRDFLDPHLQILGRRTMKQVSVAEENSRGLTTGAAMMVDCRATEHDSSPLSGSTDCDHGRRTHTHKERRVSAV